VGLYFGYWEGEPYDLGRRNETKSTAGTGPWTDRKKWGRKRKRKDQQKTAEGGFAVAGHKKREGRVLSKWTGTVDGQNTGESAGRGPPVMGLGGVGYRAAGELTRRDDRYIPWRTGWKGQGPGFKQWRTVGKQKPGKVYGVYTRSLWEKKTDPSVSVAIRAQLSC